MVGFTFQNKEAEGQVEVRLLQSPSSFSITSRHTSYPHQQLPPVLPPPSLHLFSTVPPSARAQLALRRGRWTLSSTTTNPCTTSATPSIFLAVQIETPSTCSTPSARCSSFNLGTADGFGGDGRCTDIDETNKQKCKSMHKG